MENQHRQITGYRDLGQSEIDKMNAVKAQAAEVGALKDQLTAGPDLDQRRLSIARTHLQQGFMAGVRAIAQPTTV